MSFFDRFLRKGTEGKTEGPGKSAPKDPKTSYRRYKPTLRKPKTIPPQSAPVLPPPLVPGSSTNKRGKSQRTAVPTTPSRKRRRLLLLDDDVQLCEVLTSLFQWHGYEVTTVNRGVEGVQEIMRSDYDAIVCDIVMPVMRGDVFYVAVERVKPELCKRFVFITGNTDDSQVMFFLRSKGVPVVFKPLDTTALLGTIEAMIERESGAGDGR